VYNGTLYGRPASWALLAGMLGYGTANTAFSGLALILISRRELGILKRIRATPLPTAAYMTAVLTSIMIVFALQAASLFVLGKLLKSTPWPTHVFSLVLTLALGAAAFAGLGLAITGFVRSLEGSSAVLNVIVLPMAFLSGSFGERRHYPAALRAIGDVLPLKYLLDAVNAIYLHGKQLWDKPTAVAVLAAWGAAGIAIAVKKFRWEPREG
jgi:ABC-2 type transport system permease protein